MKSFFFSLILLTGLIHNVKAQASRQWEDIDTTGYYNKETQMKDGYTLVFINKDSTFSTTTISRLKDAFWKIYPLQVKRFNKKSSRQVTVMIGQEYRGVAATWNKIVKIDQNWLKRNPEDIDVITHELMHVVQDYTYDIPDSWLTDAIADYGRHFFGINNSSAGWALPKYQSGQSYRDSYRTAASFLLWVEKNKCKKIVEQLDKALRSRKYQREIWKKLTGKDLDELWKEYAESATA